MPADQWLTQVFPLGLGGLDLKRPIDQISPARLSRMTNITRGNEEASLTAREGISTIGTTLNAEVHSQIRLNDRINGGFARLAGVGSTLWCSDNGGVYNQIDQGYSGNPLTMLAYHPPQSGETWAYIADSNRMRKVRVSDCLDLQIGFPPPPPSDTAFQIDEFALPTHIPVDMNGAVDQFRVMTVGFTLIGDLGVGVPGDLTHYAPLQVTVIDNCDTAGWTNNAGTGGAPTNVVDVVDFKQGTGSLKLGTQNGAAVGAYYNFWNKAKVINLGVVGSTFATDDDIFHIWIKTDRPDVLDELRIYFVLSTGAFDLTTIPGTSATLNTDAFEKPFRPSDFTNIYEMLKTSLTQSPTANTNLATIQQLSKTTDKRASTLTVRQQTERQRKGSTEVVSGRGAWTEFGIIGSAVHRRDFAKIGGDTTLSWPNVVGIVITAQMATNADINIWLDDIHLEGGYGLDSSLIGMTSYDYRYTHFDPRTGAESNPSPIQSPGFRLDSLRRGIVVTPTAFGDPAVFQKIYRRGGSIPDNWYFVGKNGGDGFSFLDSKTDLEAISAAILAQDNDQPVTTVDDEGNAVFGQNIQSIWGPVQDIVFGCGDAFRKGHIYWCKPTMLDSWPAAFSLEVCSPSEELISGCIFQGQSYAFSRERMFSIIPNISNAAQVIAVPTANKHGLIFRRALVVGLAGIFYVGFDDVYRTTGGAEEPLGDDHIRGLFHGETRNGYLPIDLEVPEAIRLEIFDNYLRFFYQDTSLTRRCLVYSILYNFWSFFDYGGTIGMAYAEEGVDFPNLLLGGLNGNVFEEGGTNDDGVAIDASFRTGALDQGSPREGKLYGDIIVDANRNGNVVTVTPLTNNEANIQPAQLINTLANRQRYYVDTGDVTGLNMSIDVSWSSADTPPVIYRIGPSFTLQPDTATLRATNWDSQQRMVDKFVKGVILEIDTFGQNKIFNVQADLATQATITVNTNGRLVKQFSFSQFGGRLLRLQPADTVEYRLFSLFWVYDDEPLALTRWETQETDNGIPLWQSPLYAHLTYKALQGTVNMNVLTTQQNGITISKNYAVPSMPSDEKHKVFVPFDATKGVLFKYTLTSDFPFVLYRAESQVFMKPWPGEVVPTSPFGDADRDPTQRDLPQGVGLVPQLGGQTVMTGGGRQGGQ